MGSGKYAIGFLQDDRRYFHLKFGKKTIVGGYENLFGKHSTFYYKALSPIDAYSLRYEKFRPIMDKYPEFNAQYTTYMVNYFYTVINKPMQIFKRNIISSIYN